MKSLNCASNEVSKERNNKVIEEVKKQLKLAGPLLLVCLLQFGMQMMSVMFVGHLGKLALSAASMATSFATVTSFSLLIGMASALETLCGQSYGAKQYHMLGILMQRAMIILLLVGIPLALVLANTKTILIIAHQDHLIAAEAGLYAQYLIPCVFAYGLVQCLCRFLQTQNIGVPMIYCCGITTLLHLPICWFLVFKSGLGSRGAALANSVSTCVNVLMLSLYVKFSSSCQRSWTGFSMQAFHNMLAFIRLAVPSAIMVCIEMWSFELLVLLSGLLPNPQLETSVLSISLTSSAVVFMILFGLGGAVSTRVSNELGAGRPEAARFAVIVVVVMALIEGLVAGLLMISMRSVWGHAFSNDKEVTNYVARLMPFTALSVFLNALLSVFSGIARGCGWQKIGAYINLGSYYLVGIPCAVGLAFHLHMGGKGLWIGLICALTVQVISLFILTIRTNWKGEANKATERVNKSANKATEKVNKSAV